MKTLLMAIHCPQKNKPAAILAALVLFCQAATAQPSPAPFTFANNNVQYIETDSGLIVLSFTRQHCKNYVSLEKTFIAYEKPVPALVQNVQPALLARVKFLTVHGNVSYDFFYRSRIDTPINQQHFRQHTESVYLDVMVKEKYPLRVNFISRQSNSPYFRDFVDINFNFDRYTYNKTLKQQILDKLKSQVPQYKLPDLSAAKELLKKYQEEFNKTKSWLESPGTLQKLVEEREKAYYEKLNSERDDIATTNPGTIALPAMPDSIAAKLNVNDSINRGLAGKMAVVKNKSDSLLSSFSTYYDEKKSSLDSLEKNISRYKAKVDSIEKHLQKDITAIRQKIYNATSEKELRKLAAENGIETDKKTKLEKQLAAIKTLSLGRSVLNYTELTAQNITVSGINIEYTPSYYAAFAAGRIDYRFRDFYNRKERQNNQYIILGRFGFGDLQKRAIIFSYFTGRKSNNYGYRDSANSNVNLAGYSVEAILKKNENSFLSAEFAKSTKPLIGSLSAGKQSGSLLQFGDPSNMGINFKAQTIIPETNTRLSGFYRKTGENFQSFSLFSYNSNQTAWLARVDQSFFKNRLTLTSMIRQNDFTNPFADKTYKTSTVFKSILLNARFKKLPVISLGYYPGTQLYLVDRETIRESAYYILNGSLGYSYIIKRLSMNSMLVYNKYTSEATDSGFIAYKGVNIYASQAVRFRKLLLQGGYAYTRQSLLQYGTAEFSGDYSLNSWLQLGAGAKYNKVKSGNAYWGENIQIRTDFKKLGGFQLQYEKSYLPTITGILAPVEIGRVSYYKRF
ncbi:MAG: hypothetical protein QM687_11750 [Ferruginibacter sp.]